MPCNIIYVPALGEQITKIFSCVHPRRLRRRIKEEPTSLCPIMVSTMPIRLAQVIYISLDSDAPARPRISSGSPISFVLSSFLYFRDNSGIMPHRANLCQPDRHGIDYPRTLLERLRWPEQFIYSSCGGCNDFGGAK
jgi:hypothetical protein